MLKLAALALVGQVVLDLGNQAISFFGLSSGFGSVDLVTNLHVDIYDFRGMW
jgi:hypothetical protein